MGQYLHSTMLLLYPQVNPCRSIWRISFTFHYASTLSYKGTGEREENNNLHSTMLLLYPIKSTWFSSLPRRIYIPLCFYFIGRCGLIFISIFINLHSTMLLLYPNALHMLFQTLCIYIPLCFYFIPKDLDQEDRAAPFTFHYASTLSQYSRCVQVMELNLHSTMLLLYRRKEQRNKTSKHIYIPLCFYFIRPCQTWSGCACSDLHSTMLLLYPW